MSHILTSAQLTNDDLSALFHSAEAMRGAALAVKGGAAEWKRQVPTGTVLATLFFEPSTRTRLSFESAMKRLGGEVISATGSDSLSVSKGETLADTIEAVSRLADVIVVRSTQPIHEWFSCSCWGGFRVPVINAGDGGNNHPTQALLDAYTIWRHRGECRPDAIDHVIPCNKVFGIVGDIEKSRTIRSFIEVFSRNQSNRFILFDSTGRGAKFHNWNRFDDIQHVDTEDHFVAHMQNMDILYLNRVQKERHVESVKGHFVLSHSHLQKLKPTCLVLNPGPRQEEIPVLLDYNPAVKMWEQVENGLYVRMALLKKVLGR